MTGSRACSSTCGPSAGDSRWGFGVRLRDLAGLPPAAVANMANDVQFTWTREAGTFRFTGSFDQGRGSGTYTFTQDQTFVNNMAAPATRTSPPTTSSGSR